MVGYTPVSVVTLVLHPFTSSLVEITVQNELWETKEKGLTNQMRRESTPWLHHDFRPSKKYFTFLHGLQWDLLDLC